MKKNKKTFAMLAIILICLLMIGILLIIQRKNQKTLEKNSVYFQDKITSLAEEDVISRQEEVDEELQKYKNDKSYTWENPKVIINPYLISPLSAIVIFQEKVGEIEVYINDLKMTTITKNDDGKYAIPIYGLRAGYDNKVELKADGKTKEITISTEKYIGQTLNVETKNTIQKDNFYFAAAPMGLGVSAFDAEGNIVFYITENYCQDIEFLKNGHILVSNGETTGGEFGFTGFYEIDYLGKIYHNYVLENAYHHEVNELENGNLLIAGSTNKQDALQDFVYTIDRQTGKVLDSLSVYELIKGIDSEFAEKIYGKNFINNSIYYDEKTDEMILSLRGVNSIISVQYKEKKLNWILGEEKNWSSKFSSYLLHFTDGSRYPTGQHTAFLTSEGYLGVFNNDFDYSNVTDTSLNHYRNNYSTATLYEINNKNIKTIYEYVGPEKGFNYALGSFNITKDNTKLVNFGWLFKEEAFMKNLNIYDYYGFTYSRIVELDENDNVLFNATIDQSIYRAFKHSLYEDKTDSYNIEKYSLISNVSYNQLEKVKTDTLYEELNQAVESIYEFNLTKKSLEINAIFDDLEEVQILFVGEENTSYILNYKKKNEEPIKKIHLNLDGKYAIYLKVNDTLYDTGRILSF